MPLCIGDTSLTPSTADKAVFGLEHVQIMACAGDNRSEFRGGLDPIGIGMSETAGSVKTVSA
jgi:hypothetical protein